MRNRELFAIVLVGAFVAGAPTIDASRGSSHRSSSSKREHKASKERCTSCGRDTHGRIKRSEDAKHEFERMTGFPGGRKGYVIDHVVPLACGGKDEPSNMQWQTVAEAKAKDRVERIGCR